eukprot:jgi/Hompol1/2868/HPOL_006201-RA
MLSLKLEFTGGMELLFDKQKKLALTLPDPYADSTTTLRELISFMKTNLLKERPELFVQGETVNPCVDQRCRLGT